MRAVLTYHSVDSSGSAISVSESAFREHVAWLSSGGVRVVPLLEVVTVDEDENAVAVTFDDGLESFGRIAAPLLERAGIPVTLFVVPRYVGRHGSWKGTGNHVPVFPLLGWAELRSLSERGVELGAHTLSHPVLTELPDDALEVEIAGSARCIEQETGVVPRTFAYPYGSHNSRVVGAVAQSFDVAVTAQLDTLRPDTRAHTIPRLDMWYYQNPRRLRAWNTSMFKAHLAVRKLARRARRMVVGAGP